MRETRCAAIARVCQSGKDDREECTVKASKNDPGADPKSDPNRDPDGDPDGKPKKTMPGKVCEQRGKPVGISTRIKIRISQKALRSKGRNPV